jgi:hypothetical protein
MKKVEEQPLLSGYAAYPTETPMPVNSFASNDHQPVTFSNKT